MFRRKPKPPPPPNLDAVPARWRPQVDDIARLSAELQRLTSTTADGPVRDRMTELQTAVAAHVADITAVATRSESLIRLTETVDVDAITAAYKRARRDDAPDADDLQRQFASAQRILNSLDDFDGHIAAAAMRVRELVLAAGELAITGSQTALEETERSMALLAGEASALSEAVRTLS